MNCIFVKVQINSLKISIKFLYLSPLFDRETILSMFEIIIILCAVITYAWRESSKVYGLFGGHRNPEQRSKPRMPRWKRLPRAARKWTLLGRPVAYTKVALPNANTYLLYIKGRKKRKIGYDDNAMSGRLEEVMTRDMRGDYLIPVDPYALLQENTKPHQSAKGLSS